MPKNSSCIKVLKNAMILDCINEHPYRAMAFVLIVAKIFLFLPVV